MKNVTLALVFFLGISAVSFAQEKENERREPKEKMSLEQRNAQHLKRLTSDLNLTEAQQKELVPIIAEQTKKMEAQKDLQRGEKQEMRSKNVDDQIEMKTKISKILNAEQMQKWEVGREERKNRKHKMKDEHKDDK